MLCVALLFAFSTSLCTLVRGECHVYEKYYYSDIGCVPGPVDDSGCPTSYDCSSLEQRSPNKCYYQGKAYEEGHKLEETPDAPCLVECRCESAVNNTVAFTCINVECPSELGPPPEPGCYNVHEHGQCCSVKEICETSSKEGEAEGKTPKDVCEYKNKTYQVGEQFYPDENSCLKCICGPGYAGIFEEPFCRKINCSLELNYAERIMEGCVPVYYGDNDCCPHDWRCPDLSDSVLPSESGVDVKDARASDKSCKFGELTLRVGERLNPVTEARGEWQCSCRVPPHPICIETPQLREGTCHEYERNYYEETGCRPETVDEAGCPTSYDCSSLSERNPDKCYYQGTAYDEGAMLDDGPPCLAACRCHNSSGPGGRMKFSCARVECPEHFGRRPSDPNCYSVYEHGKCCRVGVACVNAVGGKKAAAVCEYKGTTYNLGEKFFPEEEPCRVCICQEGYNGSLVEPICRKFSCNYELTYSSRIKDGCVPVFYGKKRCCPIDWRCPESADTVVTQVSKSGPDSGKTCRFGELTMQIGDKLNIVTEGGIAGRDERVCTCRIPPHPLCVQTDSPTTAMTTRGVRK